MAGKHTGSIPPYGYIKHPGNKDLWIVDEPAAEVVRRIFQLYMAGKGAYQICCILSGEKIAIPAHHQAQHGIENISPKVLQRNKNCDIILDVAINVLWDAKTYPMLRGEKMKTAIQPKYFQAKIKCSCGNEFSAGSTKENIHVEVCSKCHPFYTGTQKLIVDDGGAVGKFKRKYGLK